MTEAQAIKLVRELMAAYRTVAKISDDTFDIYVTDLVDLDCEPCALAVKTLRQTRTFLPSIAEVRQLAAELTGGHLPDGDEAWAEVTDQIRAVGWSGRPTFSHPAITETVRAMGWLDLCASTNHIADRAHFLTLYAACRGRVERQRQVAPEVAELTAVLAGRYQLEQAAAEPVATALPAPEPVLTRRPMRELLKVVRDRAPEPRSRTEQLASLRAAFPNDFTDEAVGHS